MRQTIIILLIINLFPDIVLGQYDALSKYYLVDNSIKKCKVKKSIATPTDSLYQAYITEYDKLGRQTAWYYQTDTVTTHFELKWTNDTLIKKHLIRKNNKFSYYYKQEYFHYNRNNKIVYYLAVNKNYSKEYPSCEVSKDVFKYNKKGDLMESKHFYNENYSGEFKIDLNITDTALELLSTFQYTSNSKDHSFSRKENSMRAEFNTVDTFEYNKKGELTRYVQFQLKGYMGHQISNNIFLEFKFERNDKEIVFTLTQSRFERANSVVSKSISELNPCGLEVNNYSMYSTKKLFKTTTYEYY